MPTVLAPADIPAITRRTLLATPLLPALASCATPPMQPCPQSFAAGTTIYAVAAGWHTGIALPATAIQSPLSELLPYFPDASYLLFGWGARSYYTSKHPDSFDALRALLPGPAVLLITPLPIPIQANAVARRIFPITLSTAGFARISDLIWTGLRKSTMQKLQPLEPGPWPGSLFFADTGTYSAAYTCNTWTAEALHTAGVPVTASKVIFADQVVSQLATCSKTMKSERFRLIQSA